MIHLKAVTKEKYKKNLLSFILPELCYYNDIKKAKKPEMKFTILKMTSIQ